MKLPLPYSAFQGFLMPRDKARQMRGFSAGSTGIGTQVMTVRERTLTPPAYKANGIMGHTVSEEYGAGFAVGIKDSRSCVRGVQVGAVGQQTAGDNAVMVEVVVVAGGNVHTGIAGAYYHVGLGLIGTHNYCLR